MRISDWSSDVCSSDLSLMALAIAGASDMFSVYVRQSLIQIYTPDDKRGRVGAVSQLTISASNELGAAESGFLASLVGPVGPVLVGGGGAIVVPIVWTYLSIGRASCRTSACKSVKISLVPLSLNKNLHRPSY